jgi:hypothetical protein
MEESRHYHQKGCLSLVCLERSLKDVLKWLINVQNEKILNTSAQRQGYVTGRVIIWILLLFFF